MDSRQVQARAVEKRPVDYARLFDASPTPFLVLDRNLHIVTANRAYLESTGRTLQDIVGRWVWDAFPTDPETLRQSVESFQRVLRSGKPDVMALLRFDIPKPESEGGGFEERYWSIVHAPVLDDAGDVALVLQHPIDVTELQRPRGAVHDGGDASLPGLAPEISGIVGRAQAVHEANQFLAAESERLRELFQKAPGFMVLFRGPEHVIEIVNDKYCEIVGRSDLVGKPLCEAQPELAQQPFVALLGEAYRTGRPYAGRSMRRLVQRAPGAPLEERYLDLLYQPMRGPDGKVWGVFAQGHDITEHHRALEALRERDERHRLILQSSSMGTWDWDVAGAQFELSAALLRTFGLETSPVPIELVLARVHPDDLELVQAALAGAMDPAGSGELRAQHRICRPDGTLAWVDVVGQTQFAVAPDGARRAVRVAGVSWDLTEQQRLVESLREADARKNEFLATLAHELRNPLAPLRNVVSLFKRVAPMPEQAPMLEIMERQIGQLRRLVEDLLEVSRITQGKIALKREPMTVSGPIYAALEATQPLVEQRGQVLEARVRSSAVIDIDGARMTQVITNLLNNAAKFTPEGGTILLEAFDETDAVLVRVRDQGIGIAPQMLPHVFELFAQGAATTPDQAQGGLGIGLSLVRRLLELHGGSVEAASAGLGHGAAFTVRLPR